MKTKILALPLILLAVGCKDRYEGQAGATSSPTPSASPYTGSSGAYASPGTTASGAGVAAVVVAVDPAGGTITLREVVAPGGAAIGDSAGRRYNVSSGAASGLNDIQAGEQVFVACETVAGSAGTGTTGSGAGTTGSGTGMTGSGTGMTGTGSSSGPGSLTNCGVITTITETGGAAGR